MKNILIKCIRWYQSMPFSCHGYCRYYPTCSEYMLKAIQEYGCLKGLYLGIKRLLRCAPWGKMGYDPVPKKEGK